MTGFPRTSRSGEQTAGRRGIFQSGRQDSLDLAQDVFGGSRQFVVAPLHDETQAQDDRIEFVVAKHQRRQEISIPEHIAEAGLALDVGALCLQRGDVAVERAKAHAEFIGQGTAAHWPSTPAQGLKKIE